ncbi:MAG TPA: hypothetical protein VG101_10595 [Puia sp.]|jgi:hypothetical protein|nr:hypothetical protein [Puia sp.]
MKYSQWIGIAAALLLAAASFMPWAYFPQLGKEFTGFFSEQNRYGRPGKVLIFFSIAMMVLFAIPKVWAKRTNIVLAVFNIAYALRCYILFTACYCGGCPEKRTGIFLVVGAAAIMVVAALLPDTPVKQEPSTIE